MLGLTPIIAHPERNPMLHAQVDRLAEWVSAGVLVGRSLAGRFGKSTEAFSKVLLDNRLVHLAARSGVTLID